MKRYVLRLIADYEIMAENITEAARAAETIGSDGGIFDAKKLLEARQWVSIDEETSRDQAR